jgi:Kazal-type serine protease inhibitor domain
MFYKFSMGSLLSLALICGGVAACNGAETPSDTAVEDVGSVSEELRACGVCGGPFDISCAERNYCQSKPGKCADTKHFGRCAPMPAACTKEYAPVCGCDGSTYGNACEAAAAGVSVASKGECQPAGAFCGGIAGIECPKGQTCVDAPDDGCDPDAGGADCGGVCVEQCGDATCAPGTSCCNPLRGICTPPGVACIQ